MSEIQSVEGRPLKKGMSPGRRSAVGALLLLVVALALLLIGQLIQPTPIAVDHVLALIEADGSVDLARSDGTGLAKLTGSGIPTTAETIRLAPGGDFVALQTPIDITIADREGVVAWRHTVRSPSATVAWSPDGRSVAIADAGGQEAKVDQGFAATGASLEIFSTIGALEWRLPLADDFGFVLGDELLAWAPDGRSIAFTGFRDRQAGLQSSWVWLADIQSQAVRQVTSDRASFDYGPVWSRTGSLAVARMTSQETGIFTVDASSGTASPIFQRAQAACGVDPACRHARLDPLVFSPDGKLLAFRDPMLGLSVLDPATRELQTVQLPDSLALPPYAWAPDGTGLFYLRRKGASDTPGTEDLVRFGFAARETTVVLPRMRAFDLLGSQPEN